VQQLQRRDDPMCSECYSHALLVTGELGVTQLFASVVQDWMPVDQLRCASLPLASSPAVPSATLGLHFASTLLSCCWRSGCHSRCVAKKVPGSTPVWVDQFFSGGGSCGILLGHSVSLSDPAG